MSQSGYTPIQLYYSTTASNTPSTSNLKLGELAFNIADNKIYALNTVSNAIQTVVGTLGNQNKNSVSITGGAIDGTTVGATTASTGAFTTLTSTTPIGISSGGTNSSATPTSGGVGYGTGTAHAFTSAGTSNQVLISNGSSAPSWASLSSIGVSSFSAGTTGLTPSSATTGAITLAGTLNVANGGTGLSSLTANYIPYGNGTSAFSSSSAFTYDGTSLSAGTFIPSSSSVPSNGLYLYTTNTLGFATNSTAQATLDNAGVFSSKSFFQSSTTAYGFTLNTLAPKFNFDGYNCAVTVSSGNSINFGDSFSGLIMVTDAGYSGCTALLICGGGGTQVISNSTSTAYFTNTSGSGDYRFYSSGSGYVLLASARTTTFNIISFRVRNST